jgi:hypothetical protein
VPSIGEWLKSVLSSGDRVGADPKLVSADQWLEWRSELGNFIQSTILINSSYAQVSNFFFND